MELIETQKNRPGKLIYSEGSDKFLKPINFHFQLNSVELENNETPTSSRDLVPDPSLPVMKLCKILSPPPSRMRNQKYCISSKLSNPGNPTRVLEKNLRDTYGTEEKRYCSFSGRKAKKYYQLSALSKTHKKLNICPKENLALQLHEIGFPDYQVDTILFATDAERVEEAMYYLFPNQDNIWEHKFVPHNSILKDY